ncbi:predicted protein [Postia placenta Mad-698-R]|nr:predicted protein [Postia placenta Mad-698-R]
MSDVVQRKDRLAALHGLYQSYGRPERTAPQGIFETLDEALMSQALHLKDNNNRAHHLAGTGILILVKASSGSQTIEHSIATDHRPPLPSLSTTDLLSNTHPTFLAISKRPQDGGNDKRTCLRGPILRNAAQTAGAECEHRRTLYILGPQTLPRWTASMSADTVVSCCNLNRRAIDVGKEGNRLRVTTREIRRVGGYNRNTSSTIAWTLGSSASMLILAYESDCDGNHAPHRLVGGDNQLDGVLPSGKPGAEAAVELREDLRGWIRSSLGLLPQIGDPPGHQVEIFDEMTRRIVDVGVKDSNEDDVKRSTKTLISISSGAEEFRERDAGAVKKLEDVFQIREIYTRYAWSSRTSDHGSSIAMMVAVSTLSPNPAVNRSYGDEMGFISSHACQWRVHANYLWRAHDALGAAVLAALDGDKGIGLNVKYSSQFVLAECGLAYLAFKRSDSGSEAHGRGFTRSNIRPDEHMQQYSCR